MAMKNPPHPGLSVELWSNLGWIRDSGHTRFPSYNSPSKIAQPSPPDSYNAGGGPGTAQRIDIGRDVMLTGSCLCGDTAFEIDGRWTTWATTTAPCTTATAREAGAPQERHIRPFYAAPQRISLAGRHRQHHQVPIARNPVPMCVLPYLWFANPGSGTRNCAFPPAASTAIRVRNRATTSSPIRAQRGPLWMKASRPGGKPRAGIAHQRISHSLPGRAVAYSSAVLRSSSFLSWKFRVVDPRLLSSRDHTRKPQLPACVHAQQLLVSLRASPLRRYRLGG